MRMEQVRAKTQPQLQNERSVIDSPSNVANLDILRCVAVLLVVVSHIWFGNYTIAVMGRLGVLFFFVHTSLVLLFSLRRLDDGRSSFRLYGTFMVRRIFRIYPLSMVLVLIIAIFSIPSYAIGTGRVFSLPMDDLGLVMNLLLVQDVIVSAGGTVPQLGQLWTLPIELRMYLLLPILYLLTKVLPPVAFSLGLWLLSVPVGIGAGWAVDRIFGYPIATYGWGWIQFPRLLEFLPIFLSGLVAYVIWPHAKRTLPFVILPALLGVITLGFYATLETVDRGHRLNLYGFIACLTVAVVIPYVKEPQTAAISKTAAVIARYSYGIYLVHLSCIWLGFDKLGNQPVPLQWSVFLAALAASSLVLYHLVEAPMIQVGKRLAR